METLSDTAPQPNLLIDDQRRAPRAVTDARDIGVTPRVVLLGLALAAFFGWAIPIIDVKFSNTYLGAAHLPPGAVGVLLILLLVVNPLLRLLGRSSRLNRLAFSRNELLAVYITCLFTTLVPGCGAQNYFVSNCIGCFYFATRENGWLTFLVPYLKPWLTPAIHSVGGQNAYNNTVVDGWYIGLNGAPIPWAMWLLPMAAWTALILVSYLMLGCLSVMLRAQWVEREALAFPLLRLPLEMTEGQDTDGHAWPAFFRHPMMWCGFGIAAFMQIMNGLNFYFPDVPKLLLYINYGQYLTEPPWNQIGPVPILILPVVVGITYLLTSEASFSLWFFYWFIKLQFLAAYYAGFTPNLLPRGIGVTNGTQSFTLYQQIGCFIAYAALVLWTGREHIHHILCRAFHFLHRRTPPGAAEREEALSYPAAFWGFVASFIFVVGWCVAAGISLRVSLLMWITYIVVAIALTRVVAEGGMLFVQSGWTPLGAFAQIFNSGPGTWLTTSSLVPASLVQSTVMTDLRAFLMPSFIQSLKLAHERRIRARPLMALVAVCTCIAFCLSVWMNVRLGYENSGLQMSLGFREQAPYVAPVNVKTMMNGARDANWTNGLWLMAGVVFTYALMLARSHFFWFPLHPLGFVMCQTYPMHALWFSIFLGWACKVLVTRFGGNAAYRQIMPLFLGLAAGDVAMMLFWNGIDAWQGRVGHQLMPG